MSGDLPPGYTQGDGFHTPFFERAYPDEECGCPVEEWVLCGVSMMIHFEPDGSIEIFADTGDWQQEVALKARTMEAARDEAFAWARSLPLVDA